MTITEHFESLKEQWKGATEKYFGSLTELENHWNSPARPRMMITNEADRSARMEYFTKQVELRLANERDEAAAADARQRWMADIEIWMYGICPICRSPISYECKHVG